MVYAYIRVSTVEQSFDGQEHQIRRWCDSKGLVIDKWISEKTTGTVSPQKRSLGYHLGRMNRGDLLICTELSRIGRNMMMVMSILNTCALKGISLKTIKDNFELDESINSKIIAFAFSLAAEIERNLISQRTREALAAKKMSGIVLGRPKGSSKKKESVCAFISDILLMRKEGSSLQEIAAIYGVHRNTLARYIKWYNLHD